MPITKKSARQDALIATADFAYGDVASGTYAAAVDVPAGAIVTGGGLAVTTLFNSATTDKFSIGDKVGAAAAAAATYAAQSADVTVAGTYIPIVPTGKKYAEKSTIGVVWTGEGAAPSAGAARLVVEYILDGRAHSSEG